MRKIFAKLSTGYAGMDGHYVFEYPKECADEEIDEDIYWRAVEHASQYGIELCTDDCKFWPECEMEHPGSTNINGYWEDYVPEKHNMYL